MRLLRTLSICILLVAAFGGLAQAQDDHIGCADLTQSADTIRVVNFKGKPGTDVEMPFYLKNDSTVFAFQFLIKFDTTWLEPITDEEDPTYLDFVLSSTRLFITTQPDPFDPKLDTTTLFQPTLFTDFSLNTREDIIQAGYFQTCLDTTSSCSFILIPPGKDLLFKLKFHVKDGMPQGERAYFQFYSSDLFIVDETVFPPDTSWFDGCSTSQMATVGKDLNGETQTFQIYPTRYPSYNMFFECDTAYVAPTGPTITSFGANPTSISSGGTSQLQWVTSNIDSVVIRNTTTSAQVTKSTMASGSYGVSPTVTTTYSLTAYKGSETAGATATVTVGGGGGNGPAISFVPAQTTYTIDQGQTVSFSVTATDTDAPTTGSVSLSVGSLSNNMTFYPNNPISGQGSVTGNFSFTPDYNQKGTFSVTFTGTDGQGTTQQSVVIIVNELQFDRLFSTSAPGQKPVGGLKGTSEILFPINVVTSKTVYGVQFDMLYDYHMVTVDSFIATDRIPEWMVVQNVGSTPGNIRVLALGLNNEPMETDTSSAILYAALTLDSNTVPWTSHTIYLENGWESLDPNPDVPSFEFKTDSGIVEVDNPGDVNLDKQINVGDAVNIVAKVVGTYDLSRRQFATADLDVSEAVDVFDLMGVINLIYGIPISPEQGVPVPGPGADIALAYNDMLSGGSDVMKVTSELPEQIAGVQLDISYDPNSVTLGKPALAANINPKKFGFSYKDNGSGQLRLLIYHMDPGNSDELIQAGAADLVDVPILASTDVTSGDKSKVRLSGALLSTADTRSVLVNNISPPTLPGSFSLRQNFPNPFNPSTTIEFSIGNYGGDISIKPVRLDVFNILGQKVRSLYDGMLPAGDHTFMWDATSDGGERVATGIYLYRLTVGDERQTKKMLYLK